MDVRELKKLLKNSTSVLILDDGEPAFVVLDYAVYKNTMLDKDREKEIRINHPGPGGNGSPDHPAPLATESRESEILERLNKEISALKHQIELEERKEFGVPQGEEQ